MNFVEPSKRLSILRPELKGAFSWNDLAAAHVDGLRRCLASQRSHIIETRSIPKSTVCHFADTRRRLLSALILSLLAGSSFTTARRSSSEPRFENGRRRALVCSAALPLGRLLALTVRTASGS